MASIGARPAPHAEFARCKLSSPSFPGRIAGRRFKFRAANFIIGRETDCHLVLDSNSVSRHDCVLLLDEYTLRIRDLANKNGTFVNRDQTRTGERILVHGDTVRVGDLVVRIELESGTASASLETQDVGPETIDHPGHSPEKPEVDQPTSADASQKAAKDL
ncbi:MAG TPA: FHA domain-containing protein [Planctomycetaceae bacterium]|nr:FHA domain-containing protein [Planctomycetaceae bacterium]